MDYLDFELKIGAGSGRDYPVEVIRSPAGEQRATMHFPFDELELENRLQALEIALLKSGGTRREVTMPREEHSVEDFGRAMFAALLSDEVRSCYRLSRQTAQAEGKGLRLRLRIEAPELAALPWEFIYDETEGDFVCLSNETPIIRYLEVDRPPLPLSIEPPLKILGLVASPADRSTLDVAREKERMERALADLEAAGLVSLTWLEGQTWRDLQRAMRQGPWHVFHFVGHGGFDTVSGEGLLALADEEGRTFRLPATKLGRLLADHNALRLVILNACEGAQGNDSDIFSSTASVLIRRGIPAVVAMQYEITDRAAIEFAHIFYEAVAEGLPVDAAVAEARKGISFSVSNTVEWGTPVLHMRAPEGRLFDVGAAVISPAEISTPAPGAADSAPTPGVERQPAEPHASLKQESALAAEEERRVEGEAGASLVAEATDARASDPAGAPSQARSSPRVNLKWGLAAVGIIAVVVVGFIMLSSGSGSEPPLVEALSPKVASVRIIPVAETVEENETVRLNVMLLDSANKSIEWTDLQQVRMLWSISDEALATVEKEEGRPEAIMTGLAIGTATITVAVSDTAGSSEGGARDSKRITVMPSVSTLNEAERQYLIAERSFNAPDSSNAAVLSQYENLLTEYGSTLESSELISRRDVDSTISQLHRLIALYDETERCDASDTLTIFEEKDHWQQYLNQAQQLRESPATTRITEVVDSLQTIGKRSAELVSLVVCRIGALDCPQHHQITTFGPGETVYFSAKVKVPRRQKLQWEWQGPDREALNDGEEAWIDGPSSGYRIYKSLHVTQQVGAYQLKVHNENGHLIGFRTFTIE